MMSPRVGRLYLAIAAPGGWNADCFLSVLEAYVFVKGGRTS